MAEKAQVLSVGALQAFRASLLVFLGRARPALEEIGEEVIQTRAWLQSDRRLYWENQVRRRQKALEEAQQALFAAGMAHLRASATVEQMAVNRAKRALTEAEEKLRRVKQWCRDFDSRVEPLARQLESLRHFMARDLPRAAAYLAQAIKTLDAYADLSPVSEASGLAAPAEASAPEQAKPAGEPAGPEGGPAPAPPPTA